MACRQPATLRSRREPRHQAERGPGIDRGALGIGEFVSGKAIGGLDPFAERKIRTEHQLRDGNHVQQCRELAGQIAFARAYLTWSLVDSRWYLYSDTQITATRSFLAKLLYEDAGIAVRPFERAEAFEVRVGAENSYDPQAGELETRVYVGIRFIF